MGDSLYEMSVFAKVVATGSLSSAARDLGVSTAVVSRRLAALEARLGVRLVNRTTRRLALTDEGASYHEACARILGEIEDADAAAAAKRVEPQGLLKVALPASFGHKHIAPLVPPFAARYPKIQLAFSLSDRTVNVIEEGYDLAIRIGGALDANCVAIKLAANRRVVCGTPAYFRRHGRPKTLDDLARHNCLAFNAQGGQQHGWLFRKSGRPINVKVAGNLDCSDGELLHRWAVEGLGLAWRSTWEIAPELERNELVTVLDDYALPSYDIHAVYPQQRHVPARLKLFVDCLKAMYARTGYWSGAPKTAT